jgi:hypothetical protein
VLELAQILVVVAKATGDVQLAIEREEPRHRRAQRRSGDERFRALELMERVGQRIVVRLGHQGARRVMQIVSDRLVAERVVFARH